VLSSDLLPSDGSELKLAVWKTHLAYDGLTNTEFIRQTDVTVSATSPSFEVQVNVDDILTVSTLTNGPSKGSFSTPPARTNFPVPYLDDFDECPLHSEAPYFYDQAGSFECLAAPGGRSGVAMRQQVPALPICWGGDILPVSMVGTDQFTDTDQQVDFFFEEDAHDNATVVLASRMLGQTKATGIFVSIALDGTFSIFYSLESQVPANGPSPAHQGALPVSVTRGEWHTLSLSVTGARISAQLDGHDLVSQFDISDCNCPVGFAGIAVGAWEPVWFDNYKLSSATDNDGVCQKPAAG